MVFVSPYMTPNSHLIPVLSPTLFARPGTMNEPLSPVAFGFIASVRYFSRSPDLLLQKRPLKGSVAEPLHVHLVFVISSAVRDRLSPPFYIYACFKASLVSINREQGAPYTTLELPVLPLTSEPNVWSMPFVTLSRSSEQKHAPLGTALEPAAQQSTLLELRLKRLRQVPSRNGLPMRAPQKPLLRLNRRTTPSRTGQIRQKNSPSMPFAHLNDAETTPSAHLGSPRQPHEKPTLASGTVLAKHPHGSGKKCGRSRFVETLNLPECILLPNPNPKPFTKSRPSYLLFSKTPPRQHETRGDTLKRLLEPEEVLRPSPNFRTPDRVRPTA